MGFTHEAVPEFSVPPEYAPKGAGKNNVVNFSCVVA
jgi:hypothetical protein